MSNIVENYEVDFNMKSGESLRDALIRCMKEKLNEVSIRNGGKEFSSEEVLEKLGEANIQKFIERVRIGKN